MPSTFMVCNFLTMSQDTPTSNPESYLTAIPGTANVHPMPWDEHISPSSMFDSFKTFPFLLDLDHER